MVTASHNPKEFNGMKIGLGKTTIYGEEIQNFRRLAESGKFLSGHGSYSSLDPVPDYIKMLRARVQFQRALKVVLRPGQRHGRTAGRGTAEDVSGRADLHQPRARRQVPESPA